MTERVEAVRYDECGLTGVVLDGVPVRTCPKCGERMVGIPRIAELHRELAKHIAVKAERLAPAEVKFLRKVLGLSGEDFAARMGVDRATISRWESTEKPQGMGEPAERLLRVLVLSGKRVEEYPVEMATKEAKPERIRLAIQKGEWRAEAA